MATLLIDLQSQDIFLFGNGSWFNVRKGGLFPVPPEDPSRFSPFPLNLTINPILIQTSEGYHIYTPAPNLGFSSLTSLNLEAPIKDAFIVSLNPEADRPELDFSLFFTYKGQSLNKLLTDIPGHHLIYVNSKREFSFYPSPDLIKVIPIAPSREGILAKPIGTIFADGGVGALLVNINGEVMGRSDVNKSPLIGYVILPDRGESDLPLETVNTLDYEIIRKGKSSDIFGRETLSIFYSPLENRAGFKYGSYLFEFDLQEAFGITSGDVFTLPEIYYSEEWNSYGDLYVVWTSIPEVKDEVDRVLYNKHRKYALIAGSPPNMTILASNMRLNEMIEGSIPVSIPDTSRTFFSFRLILPYNPLPIKPLKFSGIPLSRIVSSRPPISDAPWVKKKLIDIGYTQLVDLDLSTLQI